MVWRVASWDVREREGKGDYGHPDPTTRPTLQDLIESKSHDQRVESLEEFLKAPRRPGWGSRFQRIARAERREANPAAFKLLEDLQNYEYTLHAIVFSVEDRKQMRAPSADTLIFGEREASRGCANDLIRRELAASPRRSWVWLRTCHLVFIQRANLYNRANERRNYFKSVWLAASYLGGLIHASDKRKRDSFIRAIVIDGLSIREADECTDSIAPEAEATLDTTQTAATKDAHAAAVIDLTGEEDEEDSEKYWAELEAIEIAARLEEEVASFVESIEEDDAMRLDSLVMQHERAEEEATAWEDEAIAFHTQEEEAEAEEDVE